MSICDIIVMLKWRHRVACMSNLRTFLKPFACFSNIKMQYLIVIKKKNPVFVWRWDRKISLSQSPFVSTRQASWCQTVILMMDFKAPQRHIVSPSVPLCLRCISPTFFEVGIPNLVCGCTLGWRSVSYHFRVTVTFTIDLVFRIFVSGAYLLYYLR